MKARMLPRILSILILAGCPATSGAAPVVDPEQLRAAIDESLAELSTLYRHLHQTPELSNHEASTAKRLAEELSKRGFTVSTGVGGHGVVAVLENGAGPTLLIRTDLDGLPMTEVTDLPFASKVKVTDDQGMQVGVMHACGHDVHMTGLVGTAEMLAGLRDRWQGTLVLIGQPAEEIGAGAAAMLADGLFVRFPVPDYALAFHVAADLPAGTIGYTPGFSMANVDSVDIEIFGIGGHGALPHQALDPVVIAARVVLGLQTIVSREIDPLESAVITVGHISAGTKRNIIPERALLQLTVRSYSDEVRSHLFQAIERTAINTARAAGVSEDRLPKVTITNEGTPSLYNDPTLTDRLLPLWQATLGPANVVVRKPEMIGEDYARYGRTPEDIPILMFRVGTAKVTESGFDSQSLHSPEYAPDAEPALRTAILTMTESALELLQPERQ